MMDVRLWKLLSILSSVMSHKVCKDTHVVCNLNKCLTVLICEVLHYLRNLVSQTLFAKGYIKSYATLEMTCYYIVDGI